MKRLIIAMLGSSLLLLATLLALSAHPQSPPVIKGITPNTGPNDQQTPITITGQGFTSGTLAYLDDAPLLRVTYVDSATLQVRVPFGLDTGVYTLTVTDAETATLTNAFTMTAGSGWATGGPYGGNVRYLAINPVYTSTIYAAAASSGLYRSTNGGQYWTQVLFDPALRAGSVAVWPVSPTVVFLGGVNGLYRSEQSGDVGSWTYAISGTDNGNHATVFAIAPSDPYTMYFAARGNFYHSSDGGATWQVHGPGLSDDGFGSLDVDPSDPAVVYATGRQDKKAVYKTDNGGMAWTRTFTVPQESFDQSISSLTAAPYRPGVVWLGTYYQGLYRSLDSGETFTQVTTLPADEREILCIRFDPNRDRIFVGTYQGHYSDDGGNTWQSLGLLRGPEDIAITSGDGSILYAGGTGVRKSTDGGQNWGRLQEGIVAFDPISPTVAYVDGRRGISKTIDDGQSWQPTADLPWTELPGQYEYNTQFVAIHPRTHTIVYVGARLAANDYTVQDGALFRSMDGGDTWKLITTTGAISLVGRIVFAPGHPETIYLTFRRASRPWPGGNGILRSDDEGQT